MMNSNNIILFSVYASSSISSVIEKPFTSAIETRLCLLWEHPSTLGMPHPPRDQLFMAGRYKLRDGSNAGSSAVSAARGVGTAPMVVEAEKSMMSWR